MTEKIINNTIIFDGEKEHIGLDIYKNDRLKKFLNDYYIWHFPKDFQNEVVEQNGTFYISTNNDLSNINIKLKNVSQETLDRFYQIYN
ncbi:hypothetical protein [Mangrovimonas futianensis]|nr:hypothetical protein [Mangrovimonas futianensis]MCF1423244.1 hypothetical protein [Mangrovimonas futianensis]